MASCPARSYLASTFHVFFTGALIRVMHSVGPVYGYSSLVKRLELLEGMDVLTVAQDYHMSMSADATKTRGLSRDT